MVIVCPGGQEVGDQKSGDQMGSGPNVSQLELMYTCILCTSVVFMFSKSASYRDPLYQCECSLSFGKLLTKCSFVLGSGLGSMRNCSLPVIHE